MQLFENEFYFQFSYLLNKGSYTKVEEKSPSLKFNFNVSLFSSLFLWSAPIIRFLMDVCWFGSSVLQLMYLGFRPHYFLGRKLEGTFWYLVYYWRDQSPEYTWIILTRLILLVLWMWLRRLISSVLWMWTRRSIIWVLFIILRILFYKNFKLVFKMF